MFVRTFGILRTFQRIGVFGKTPSKRAKYPKYPLFQKYRKYHKYAPGLGKGDMEDASYRHSALLALRAKSLAALGSPLSQLR